MQTVKLGTGKQLANAFEECPECTTPADSGIGILPPKNVALFIENKIEDSNLDPCSSQILNQLKNLQQFDITEIITRFGVPNSVYTWNLNASILIFYL
ncbi:MAG: hypothetical protein U1C58_00790 [Flavobacteriaceae bacterium]|nr:hypothetical protein [Flavobacteriaceae bacterium]